MTKYYPHIFHICKKNFQKEPLQIKFEFYYSMMLCLALSIGTFLGIYIPSLKWPLTLFTLATSPILIKKKSIKTLVFGLLATTTFGLFHTCHYLNRSILTPQEIQKLNASPTQMKITGYVHITPTHWKSNAILLPSKKKVRLKSKRNIPVPRYGDIVFVSGQIKRPSPPSNPGQFNLQHYYKIKQIAGTFHPKTLHILENRANPIKKISLELKKKVIAINQQTLPAPYADLYTGLVFGDHGTNLPQELSEQYRKVGLLHLLVVSGSQVALLSGILFNIGRILGLKGLPLFWIISACNVIFYFITGGGASIFRAVMMNEITLLITSLNRKPQIYHVMSLSALTMILLNPMSLFDIGAQLSYLATFSLIFGVPAIEKKSPASWPRPIVNALTTSLAPFLFTTPLVWFHFQNISPISIISNLIVVSWIELLVVIGFFSTLIGFVCLPITQILNNFSWIVMIALNKIVNALSNIPYSIFYVKKTSWLTLIPLYGLLFRYLSPSRNSPTLLVIIITLFSLSTALGFLPKKTVTITYMDVGQGDATLIETPNGRTVLIDTGNKIIDRNTGQTKIDYGKSVILPLLHTKGINKLDLIITTHFDQDHIGGLESLVANIPIGAILDNGRNDPNHQNLYKKIKQKNIPIHSAMTGQILTIDRHVTLEILHPSPSLPYSQNKNNNSIVCKLSFHDIDFLFTGDLEKEREQMLAQLIPKKLASEVYKAGHHGSKTSSTPSFLRHVTPQIAIISAGKTNRYHHPHPSVIRTLKQRNITVFRTDHHGAIIIKTDGKRIYSKTMH